MGGLSQVLLAIEAKVGPLAARRNAAAQAEGGVCCGAPPPLVLMYGHSMAGAAIGVLTGCGKVRGFMHCYVSLARLSLTTWLNVLVVFYYCYSRACLRVCVFMRRRS
jgi:hypothetical protein